MAFDPTKCLLPTIWCGKGPLPTSAEKRVDRKNNVKYVKEGSKEECVQKGFGAGMFSERAKSLPDTSLQKIKYVGETYEKNFKTVRIETTLDLLTFARGSPTKSILDLILKVTTKKDGKIDHKAYNSILLWLYNNGVDSSKIPSCHRLVQ